MRRFTQCVCILLLAAVFFTVPVYAAENDMQRASNYFGTNSQYLYQTSDTSFDICFDVTAVRRMEELGASKVVLQRSSDTINWTDIKTYRKADYPEMIDYDTVFHAGSFSYEGDEGYYYRAYVRYYAKDSTGTEEFNTYSTSVTL